MSLFTKDTEITTGYFLIRGGGHTLDENMFNHASNCLIVGVTKTLMHVTMLGELCTENAWQGLELGSFKDR
jgi:hypothetical protein